MNCKDRQISNHNLVELFYQQLNEIKDPKQLVNYNVIGIEGVYCKDNGREYMRDKGFSKNQDNRRINKHGKMQGNFTKWNLQ